MVKTKKYKRKIGKKGGEPAIITACLLSKAIHAVTSATIYLGLKYTTLHNLLGAYIQSQGITATLEQLNIVTELLMTCISNVKGNIQKKKHTSDYEIKEQLKKEVNTIVHQVATIITGLNIEQFMEAVDNIRKLINLIKGKEEGQAIYDEGNQEGSYLAIENMSIQNAVVIKIRKALEKLYYGDTTLYTGSCLFTETNEFLLYFFKEKIKELLQTLNNDILVQYRRENGRVNMNVFKKRMIDHVTETFKQIKKKQEVSDEIKTEAEYVIKKALKKKEIRETVTVNEFNAAMDKYYSGGRKTKKRQTRKIHK